MPTLVKKKRLYEYLQKQGVLKKTVKFSKYKGKKKDLLLLLSHIKDETT